MQTGYPLELVDEATTKLTKILEARNGWHRGAPMDHGIRAEAYDQEKHKFSRALLDAWKRQLQREDPKLRWQAETAEDSLIRKSQA
eukprot:g15912.t1